MPFWLRLAALILAIAVILWLPVEDVDLRYVLTFSVLISGWWAARFMLKISPHHPRFTVRHIMVGTLAGIAVSPVALFLMIFKSGLHGHGAPDFTLAQMQAVLVRTPFWALAGLLLGLGIATARLAQRKY